MCMKALRNLFLAVGMIAAVHAFPIAAFAENEDGEPDMALLEEFASAIQQVPIDVTDDSSAYANAQMSELEKIIQEKNDRERLGG